MLKKIVAVGTGLVSLLIVLPCEGAVIGTWAFGTSGSDLIAPYAADSGQPGAQIEAPIGFDSIVTGVSDGNPANALQIATGGVLDIHVAGSGLADFVVTYDAKSAGTLTDIRWDYSNDGVIWTTLTTRPVTASFASYSVDFSSVAAIEGAANVYLTITPVGLGQTVNFDNIEVSAVPEPINVALVVFGFGAAVTAVGRRIRARARS